MVIITDYVFDTGYSIVIKIVQKLQFNDNLTVSFFALNTYSSLPNRHVARNKHGGGKDDPFLISVVPMIGVVEGKMSHS